MIVPPVPPPRPQQATPAPQQPAPAGQPPGMPPPQGAAPPGAGGTPPEPEGPVEVGSKAHAPPYMQRGGKNEGEIGQPWNFRFRGKS